MMIQMNFIIVSFFLNLVNNFKILGTLLEKNVSWKLKKKIKWEGIWKFPCTFTRSPESHRKMMIQIMNFIIVSFFLNLVNNFKIMDLKPVLENKSLYPPGEGRPRLGAIY